MLFIMWIDCRLCPEEIPSSDIHTNKEKKNSSEKQTQVTQKDKESNKKVHLHEKIVHKNQAVVPTKSQSENNAEISHNSNNSPHNIIEDCVVCLAAPINSVLIPCGHLAMCWDCCSNLMKVENSKKTCPICRTQVHQFIQTFKV